MKQDFQIGNSFDSQSVTLGHAKKVWRRIDEQLPGGYHLVNLSDFTGIVPSGTPVAYSTAMGADARDVVGITWDSVVSAQDVTYTLVAEPSGNPKTKGYYEYDESTHTYSATNDTSVTASKDYFEQVAAVTTDGLNIIGFIQEDVPVIVHGAVGSETYNYGTCNIIVKGELYGYMLGSTVTQATTVKAALKAMTQKNGLSIRIID